MALRLEAPPVETTDDELAARFRQGDLDALATLLHRYKRFVRAKARSYFLVGAEFDDLEQEGMIGLFKAVRDFRPDRQASFRGFAEICITRQILTAIKGATRQKHQPLNQYVSLTAARHPDEVQPRPFEHSRRFPQAADPADEVVSLERVTEIRRWMNALLSGLEVDVLRLHVEGRSYQEIGQQLGRQAKSIDNALQRVKRKLELHLAEQEAAADMAYAVPA